MTSQQLEARLDVPDSHKIGNPNSAYSWQSPPVTKCGECLNSRLTRAGWRCNIGLNGYVRYEQNKDGITTTCPMWKQQNKEAE